MIVFTFLDFQNNNLGDILNLEGALKTYCKVELYYWVLKTVRNLIWPCCFLIIFSTTFLHAQDLEQATPWKGSFVDFFDDDFDGLIENAKLKVNDWQQTQDHIQQWKVHDIPIYKLPQDKEKRKFVRKIGLKYLDKKIMDRGRKSPKNSPAHTVITMRKAMAPTSTIGLSQNFTMKFRAKLLEGKLSVILINPYLDWWADFNNHGHFGMTLQKNLADAELEMKIFYTTDQNTLMGTLKQKLIDNIFGHYEVTQKSTINYIDHKVSLSYSLGF